MPSKPVPEDHETIEEEIDMAGQPGSVDMDHLSSRLNWDAQQYLEAQSFILLEFRLNRPLVPKRTVEEMDQTVRNYLNRSEFVPSQTLSAQKVNVHYINLNRYQLNAFSSITLVVN